MCIKLIGNVLIKYNIGVKTGVKSQFLLFLALLLFMHV